MKLENFLENNKSNNKDEIKDKKKLLIDFLTGSTSMKI